MELGEELFRGRAKYVMDFVDLVEFIVAWEEGKQGENFKVDAANPPVVHLMVVVAVSEETLGWPVPPRADILSEGWLRVDASTGAKVGQLYLVLLQQNVLSVYANGSVSKKRIGDLRLDVAMKNAVSVHVVNRFEHLIHVVLDSLLWQVVAASLDRFVHVHVHQFEHEGKSPCRFITSNETIRTFLLKWLATLWAAALIETY